jgi:hypothetical protein
MKKWQIAGAALVVLLVGLLPATTSAANLQTPRFEGFGTSFKIDGSNRYQLWVSAYARGRGGRGWMTIDVVGNHAHASYRTPARVTGEPTRDGTATAIEADLGALGKVDLLLERSGVEKAVHWKCGGPGWSYEPGTYRGIFEFKGEDGYTGATVTEVPLDPMPFFASGDCNGSGSGEARGQGLPGARLKGVSFAHDRVLTFEVNKNNAHSRVVYSASVREQHEGVYIYRTIEGTTAPSAFRFDPGLRSATLSPPAPFSGSATAHRTRGSLLLAWHGDLQLAFPGHTVSLAGSNVHVSLDHAHLTRSDSASVGI